MTRLVLLTLLIAPCGGSTESTPQPVVYVLYVQGDQTGSPGPYCSVTMTTPAVLTVRSQPGVTDSAVDTLDVAPGRYRVAWAADYYRANGTLQATVHSLSHDSTNVPGHITFLC